MAFGNPAINIYSLDIIRLVSFYEGLGFRETVRTPREGTPVHVELGLDGLTSASPPSTQRLPITV
jgi:hypothetical protein